MADILLVDDDSELVQSLVRVLSRLVSPRSVVAAGNARKALELCAAERPLAAVIDLCLDEKIGVDSGFDLLAALKSAHPELRVLVLTGHGSMAHGIRAMSLGAASFLEKPADPEHLAALLKDAISQAELRRAYNELQKESSRVGAGDLCGTSAAIQKLREEIEFVATTNQPVLLLGETGTGKSHCARLIHEGSKRRSKKFIHYHPNFGGGDIVQSELFGHMKGSFTGAVENRRGLVLEGDGGTLFIDELDAVPAETQVTLLDLVQEQRVRPIGSDVFQKVDCRCIAATNRPINEALEQGVIRRDLHHRLAHCIITIPPLRERLSDLALLIDTTLRRLREREGLNVFEVDPSALARCSSYSWPGNIRELQGVVESAAYRAQFKGRSSVQVEDLQLDRSDSSPIAAVVAHDKSFHEQVESFKRTLIHQALEACGGNQVQAASMLGIDRGTIRRLTQS